MLRTSSPLLRALLVGLLTVPTTLALSQVLRWFGPHSLQPDRRLGRAADA